MSRKKKKNRRPEWQTAPETRSTGKTRPAKRRTPPKREAPRDINDRRKMVRNMLRTYLLAQGFEVLTGTGYLMSLTVRKPGEDRGADVEIAHTGEYYSRNIGIRVKAEWCFSNRNNYTYREPEKGFDLALAALRIEEACQRAMDEKASQQRRCDRDERQRELDERMEAELGPIAHSYSGIKVSHSAGYDPDDASTHKLELNGLSEAQLRAVLALLPPEFVADSLGSEEGTAIRTQDDGAVFAVGPFYRRREVFIPTDCLGGFEVTTGAKFTLSPLTATQWAVTAAIEVKADEDEEVA